MSLTRPLYERHESEVLQHFSTYNNTYIYIENSVGNISLNAVSPSGRKWKWGDDGWRPQRAVPTSLQSLDQDTDHILQYITG